MSRQSLTKAQSESAAISHRMPGLTCSDDRTGRHRPPVAMSPGSRGSDAVLAVRLAWARRCLTSSALCDELRIVAEGADESAPDTLPIGRWLDW